MKLRSFWHFGRVTFFLVDYVLLWGSVVIAFKMSPRYPLEVLFGLSLRPELRFVGYVLPLFMAVGLQMFGLERSQTGFRLVETFVQTVAGLAFGVMAFVVLDALVSFTLVGRFVLAIALVYSTALILGSRMLIWKLAERASRSVLIYGGTAAFGAVVSEIRSSRQPIRVVGHTRLRRVDDQEIRSLDRIEVGEAGLFGWCEKQGIDQIVVEIPDALEPAEREALLLCTRQGVNVVDLNYFFERNLERVYVAAMKETWFWGYDLANLHPLYFVFKRFADIAASLLGLVVFLPFAPIVVLLIKFQDRGPVIYSQIRTGTNNQPFRIFKFRTMRTDAEKEGATWATLVDHRVTWVGRILRKTRIDEVPQFWNILKGDMSVIGPRPERPEFVDLIEREVPFYRYRHLIKPGLTGWAQINYPYGASVEEARQKLSYDFYYLKYASATLDLFILLRTVVAMVKGAR